jgi:hypothetical protein
MLIKHSNLRANVNTFKIEKKNVAYDSKKVNFLAWLLLPFTDETKNLIKTEDWKQKM